ncbi:aminotransferase class IV [Marinomonas mediterranea]|jgi:Branched-chain amino acid aminotransferase/4-amino-4-deoxychorismate lyase|uniref:Aminodeoxychorismate lyase n=1 Tax=Marinomonas mediterranea (strain ATCC 700492 / JCM 21426 / NBRC 103028 / MMB-1) TaxID=717774 RepID=F2JVD4_MARM1|nr:aminotransferase class IV [Marinomonas mediterranea]ADZ89392.1 D-amino-acid transaminase [Marinomonas mediterranea MMB-1]WCN15653.1 D-alanine aminotransferase [Marinomonas mediterranea MMB-1]
MSIVYLNGEYMPMSEAKISPMDRGFLFGDGIYEVIPSYDGKLVGFAPHIERMEQGLNAIDIELGYSIETWRDISETLMSKNDGANLGIYLHVSRGPDTRRFHAYPEHVTPTVYAFSFEIAPEPKANKATVKQYVVSSTQDMRWQRCNIKSTALLGNVMHFQQGYKAGNSEIILFNANNEITEGSTSNVYIVKDGVAITPLLDHQVLPGITRLVLLDILRKEGTIKVEERVVTMDEARNADEVWLTSSSKEIVPVVELDGEPVGDGQVGDVWEKAQALYSAGKYDY